MRQRQQFIEDYLAADHTVTELYLRYGISRKTGYKCNTHPYHLAPFNSSVRGHRTCWSTGVLTKFWLGGP